MLSARALSSLSTSPPEKMSHRAVTTYPSGKGNYSMLDGDTPVKSVFPVLKHLTGPAKTFFVADRPATNTRTEVSQSGFSNNHHINSSNTPFSALKYFMQPSQLLECKSGVMCMALSPCGMMLACGTLLGQILLFAAEQTGPMPMGAAMPLEEEISLEWNQVKWLKISVLQDFSETVVDRFWNIIWAPDSSAIVAAGSCNSRHQYDPEDADMKVIPCPLVVFDLRAFSASSTSSRESLVTEPKQAIRRFEGHFEEVVDMKIWRLSPSSLPDAASGAEYMLITCSQDGHVRRWKFDQEWKHLESVLMKDEETWMAFSSVHIRLPEPLLPADATHFSGKVLDAPLIRDSNEEGVLSKESGPKIIQPTSLFLLAGDMALKLFDGATAAKLWTSQELYETYCTNVEVFRTQSSIQHPFRPNTFLNGDGYVYGDSECKHILNEEPPTFLILTKGIDFIAPDLKRDSSKKPNGASEDSDLDKELDDEYGHRRKSAPSRIVLHALRIPLTCTKAMAPSSRNGVRRTEQTVRYTVNAELIKLEPLFDYSHPLFASNYWPSRMTHNGIHVLSAAASGTIFAWNLLKSSSDANLRVHSSSNEPNAGVRKPLNCHSHISSILASHDEDLPVRDVLFHPFWPFLFSAADDGSVHVWAPTLYDPIKSCAIPTLQGVSEPPVGACLSSVIVPRGSSAALSHHIAINHPNGPIQPGLHNLQAGSVYKSAIEAAMLATVGTVMPAAVKRKRGRPHKQKLIEEIEAQFAAQEKALQAQEQLLIIDPAQAPEPNPVQSAPIQATPTYNEYNFHYDPQSNPTHLQLP
jgi:WD40 repeat protein